MELDTEKTKITQVSRRYKFLGFELRLRIKKPKLKRVLQKNHGVYIRSLVLEHWLEDKILVRVKSLKNTQKT